VAQDVELELLEAVAHLDLVVVRTAPEELERKRRHPRHCTDPRAHPQRGALPHRRVPGPAEAMWQGRPVVASGIAGLRSQVVDGETGILLDSLRLVR
jgi:hypothetical protein